MASSTFPPYYDIVSFLKHVHMISLICTWYDLLIKKINHLFIIVHDTTPFISVPVITGFTGLYVGFISEISITGDVYGFPERPVRLGWFEDTTVNGREELEWRHDSHVNLLVAKGIYINGDLTDAVYFSSLADGRAELTSGGALIIHSYEESDAGEYWCVSEHRTAVSDLITFGMWIFSIGHIRFRVFW